MTLRITFQRCATMKAFTRWWIKTRRKLGIEKPAMIHLVQNDSGELIETKIYKNNKTENLSGKEPNDH